MSGATIEGFRVVPCGRSVRGIRAGDPVVLVPVEAILADVRLLGLPTVRRVARCGLRGVVLVPLGEFAGAFPAAAPGADVSTSASRRAGPHPAEPEVTAKSARRATWTRGASRAPGGAPSDAPCPFGASARSS
jgi:hypothetical protein